MRIEKFEKMNAHAPLVSVILPAYNAAKTISETIQSVLNQDFIDWELLVINDGSIDNTAEIVSSFSDERIHLIRNGENKGLIYTLNRGIELARGPFVARIDADDIALPTRFSKQIEVMENNPDVIVCGSFMRTFGDVKKSYVISFECEDTSIKRNFPLKPVFGHPSVMIRKSVLIDSGIRYDFDYKCAEDAKLWLDLMPYGRFLNIPEVLMLYRISSTQCTQSGNIDMIENSRRCRDVYIDRSTNGWFSRMLSNKKLTVSSIVDFKKTFDNDILLLALYRSMSKFQFLVMLYCLLSLDFFKYTKKEKIDVLKRFLGRNYKVF